MKLGKKFKSFAEFQQCFEEFVRKQKVPWVTGSSKTVACHNEHQPEKPLHPSLSYAYINYTCKHTGTPRTASKGIRPNQSSFKTGCNARLRLSAQHVTQDLKITVLHVEHNHEIREEDMVFYPENRKIEGAHLKCAEDMFAKEVKPSILRDFIHSNSGKCLTSQDLVNLNAKIKREKERERLEARKAGMAEKGEEVPEEKLTKEEEELHDLVDELEDLKKTDPNATRTRGNATVMESEYIEGVVMEEGQEEWLSEGVLTDDDYNASQQTLGDQSGSNLQESQDETMTSVSADDSQIGDQQHYVIQQTDQQIDNQHIIIQQVDGQDGESSHIVLDGQEFVFQGLNNQPFIIQNADGNQQIIFQQLDGQQLDDQNQHFVIQQVDNQAQENNTIEETLNNFENEQNENKSAEAELPGELSTFLTRKYRPGRAGSDGDPSKDGDDDGNDTDDLLRVLGDGDQKDKNRIKLGNHGADSTDEDDSFIFEHKKKNYEATKNAIKRATASKALPEDDITDCSSDEATKPRVYTGPKHSKDPSPKLAAPKITTTTGVLTITPPIIKKKIVKKVVDVIHNPQRVVNVNKNAAVANAIAERKGAVNTTKIVDLKPNVQKAMNPDVIKVVYREKKPPAKQYVNKRLPQRVLPKENTTKVVEIKKEAVEIKREIKEEPVPQLVDSGVDMKKELEQKSENVKKLEQSIMQPEAMDEEVPSDAESDDDMDSLYDELPSSDSDEQLDWFTLDIRAERAGDYLPLLGDRAYELLLEEKQRVTEKLTALKKSLKVLTDSGKEQAEKINQATHTAAELDAMLRAT